MQGSEGCRRIVDGDPKESSALPGYVNGAFAV
jgi:hypothetical protein